MSYRTTRFTTVVLQLIKWVTEQRVPQLSSISGEQLSNTSFRNLFCHLQMSCGTTHSATYFVHKETHPQIANPTKSPQIPYKSFNISCVPQLLVQCGVIEDDEMKPGKKMQNGMMGSVEVLQQKTRMAVVGGEDVMKF